MLKNSIIVEAHNRWIENNDGDLRRNPEYKKVLKEFDRLWSQLEQQFPADNRDLLFELDNLIGLMILFETEESYYYGFKHGAELIIDIKK